jgi:hypothetical protein
MIKPCLIVIFLCSLLYAEPTIEFASAKGYTVSQDTIYVGKVQQGGSKTLTIKISNNGDSALQISNVRSTCPCFKISLINTEVSPQESADVFNLKIITDGLESSFFKKVYIHTNITDNEISSVFIKGEVSE